jgi:hypothetical protein
MINSETLTIALQVGITIAPPIALGYMILLAKKIMKGLDA